MSGRLRKYTEEQRREAVALAAEVGGARAARHLGIPDGTLTCWTHLARKAADAAGGAPAAADEERGATPGAGAAPDDEPDEDGSESELAAVLDARQARRKRVARRYTPTQRAEALEEANRSGPSAAARKLGLSAWSIHEWRRKERLAAEGKGESPISGPDLEGIAVRRDREVLETWRTHPGLGPSQIRNQLRRAGLKVATATVRRIMEDAGYRPPKSRRREHNGRFEAVRPNHCWHLDFVQRWIGRASTSTLILIDDHSRFVVGHAVDDAERAQLVIETFEAAVARYGKPEMVLHDKGSAFWSWKGISRFTALLEEMDVGQIEAEEKEWNGKVEVFNANIQKELFDPQHITDVPELRRRLVSHLHWYNHRRTHHALGGLLVPADRYYGRADEVLGRIEAGGVVDGPDEMGLRDRVLELFRVTSTNGRPEIWLMGTRLLG